jgi:putative nucleotidyltransferase with HDIG domain
MIKETVLVIDDEIAPRESLRMVLKDRYDVSTANDAQEGLTILSQNNVDLVVLDIMMPGMNGVEALQKIKSEYPETVVILLTAYASLGTAKSAIRFGAFDYLTKPFDKDEVIKIIEKGLDKKREGRDLRLEREEFKYKTKYLEDQVNRARQNLVVSYEGTVRALILTIDAKDHYTYDHSEHVARLSTEIANALGLERNVQNKLKQAALMHDIGKIGVDEFILRKKGPLTEEEFTEMKKHPVIGTRIIQEIPFLADALPVIRHHHEFFDGNGYPDGLRNEEIPLTARIVVVADAVDSMMRDRPYRDAFEMEKVYRELKDNAGIQFDPEIAELILTGKISLE